MPNMPMFACGIYQDNTPLLLIFVWNAQTHQRSLYYANLLRILCDLTQMSFIRAHEYSRAMHDQQYIGYTILQNAQTFRNTLHVFQELEERRVFQFLQLTVDDTGRSQEELSAVLSKCVRTNDIVGLLEDGSVWLLLSQAGPDDLKFILPRFEHQGLSVRVAEVPSPEELLVEQEAVVPIVVPIEVAEDAVPARMEVMPSEKTEIVPPIAAKAILSAKPKAVPSAGTKATPHAKLHKISKSKQKVSQQFLGVSRKRGVGEVSSQKRGIK